MCVAKLAFACVRFLMLVFQAETAQGYGQRMREGEKGIAVARAPDRSQRE